MLGAERRVNAPIINFLQPDDLGGQVRRDRKRRDMRDDVGRQCIDCERMDSAFKLARRAPPHQHGGIAGVRTPRYPVEQHELRRG